jgi:phenylacetic acid degradation operon negative regulatory protein
MEHQIQPLYEVLIYIEDQESVEIELLKKWGKTTSRGVIGKMQALGLIERFDQDDKPKVRLSQKGYQHLNMILDVLHAPVLHWDGKWRVVWFSVPENIRSIRDKFRRYLISAGLQPTLNSLWLTPLPLTDKILAKTHEFGLDGKVFIMESDNVHGLSQDQLTSAWDFDGARKLYYDFINKNEKYLTSANISKLEAKRIILDYAIVLNNEPKLPIELFPADWPKYRADQIYKKIRRIVS